MILLAVDPGPEESAYVSFNGREIREHGKQDNGILRLRLRDPFDLGLCGHCAVEMIASYGMPVGKTTFETCFWIGRFVESWLIPQLDGCSYSLVYRGEIKTHLCRSSRAKDSNIRQALIDRFGGKDKAIGRKKTPGPLYGVKGDIWSALAVAVTWWDTKREANVRND